MLFGYCIYIDEEIDEARMSFVWNTFGGACFDEGEVEELFVQMMEMSARGAWGEASRHADRHDQPGVNVLETRAVEGGGRAVCASDGDECKGAWGRSIQTR
ncbi:hypothetical protein GJ744_011198 [Endocarpon pusillum]|uniref:Uncharacterized protein n=1 Tax=Endocarpon pusillum TaxID=364733 RepID=A0A8H7AFE5_9EURO|nr:hypothetical protein GJ744_011198 [Endocarpon pusillum]